MVTAYILQSLHTSFGGPHSALASWPVTTNSSWVLSLQVQDASTWSQDMRDLLLDNKVGVQNITFVSMNLGVLN
jgi:hypothetical protein